MKRLAISLAAFAVVAGSGIAVADLTVKDGAGATKTMFDFICFTSKQCSAAVPITSAGVEIAPATAAQMTSLIAAVNGPIPAGTSLIGGVNPLPATAGGLSVETFQPTASTNSANVKSTPGQVYKIDVFNNSATVHYIRLYNSATTGTCNSATNLVWQGIIPASASGAGLSSSWDLGIAFSTGIARCVTSGYDGTGNATASAIITNIGYK